MPQNSHFSAANAVLQAHWIQQFVVTSKNNNLERIIHDGIAYDNRSGSAPTVAVATADRAPWKAIHRYRIYCSTSTMWSFCNKMT